MMRIWLWPTLIGVLTTIGLIAGLVSDGFGDIAAWIGLGVPVAVSAWFGLRRGANGASDRSSPDSV